MSGIYRGPNGSATADALNIDGDKGDLTISNSGLEWTINPDTVDFSKMQNISTNTVLGRATAGIGDVEEITCTAAGRALLDDANASAQRTTLGLGNAATATIGTEVLAYDSNLQAFVNTFILPTVDSTNGHVLTTNGTGVLSLTAPGGIADDNYGDITVSAGATVWTINNDAVTTAKILDDNVTYAKVQNVSATDRLLGRVSSGAGNIEEITCTSAGRALLDDADNTAQRTTLGLGSIATLNSISNANITANTIALDKLARVGTAGQVLTSNGAGADPSYEDLIVSDKIQPITASVATNALTITLNPTTLDFRSATLTSGNVDTVSNSSAISMVVSSGSTLGTINAVQNCLAVLAINNSGTMELAVVNIAGGVNLDETGVISTTAEGGAGGADSATVIYSTTARTNVAYRVLGFIESTQATAGTWATAPSKIQGYGGQAFAAMSSLGYGQTWQAVTRNLGTTYYNLTGKPIETVGRISGNSGVNVTLTINGTVVSSAAIGNVSNWTLNVSGIVPVNGSYVYSGATTPTVSELR